MSSKFVTVAVVCLMIVITAYLTLLTERVGVVLDTPDFLLVSLSPILCGVMCYALAILHTSSKD
jgi:hypothetical protein